jgi:hypothetical protein
MNGAFLIVTRPQTINASSERRPVGEKPDAHPLPGNKSRNGNKDPSAVGILAKAIMRSATAKGG